MRNKKKKEKETSIVFSYFPVESSKNKYIWPIFVESVDGMCCHAGSIFERQKILKEGMEIESKFFV
jgi:hypothetical protein